MKMGKRGTDVSNFTLASHVSASHNEKKVVSREINKDSKFF